MTRAAHSSDCSMKSADSKVTSKIPNSAAWAGLSILFWFTGFSTMTVTALSAPMRLGSSCVPPQPGTSPRKHSGSAMAAALLASVR